MQAAKSARLIDGFVEGAIQSGGDQKPAILGLDIEDIVDPNGSDFEIACGAADYILQTGCRWLTIYYDARRGRDRDCPLEFDFIHKNTVGIRISIDGDRARTWIINAMLSGFRVYYFFTKRSSWGASPGRIDEIRHRCREYRERAGA